MCAEKKTEAFDVVNCSFDYWIKQFLEAQEKEEQEKLCEAWEHLKRESGSDSRYNLADMWPEDLSDAIASGQLTKLKRALKCGWNVNMPLKAIYEKSLKKALKEAEKSFRQARDFKLGDWMINDLEGFKKDIISQNVHAEVIFPVTWAIKNNSFASVEWLIRHGAVLDVKSYPSDEWLCNENKHAALAACSVSQEMLRLVIENGAKIKDKTFDYWLFNSCTEENGEEYLTFLLEHGADIEAAIKAVLRAVYAGNIKLVELFLDAGFDINCHTVKGENFSKDTVLGHAAEYGSPDTVRYLLSRGADPTIRNARGMTPYDLALQNHKMDNAGILRGLCDPDGEGRRQAQEKLPQDITDYLKGGERRLMLDRDDIGYIDFLALDDVTLLRLARRKCVLLSREVENFGTLWIVWNPARKTVAYYDYENEWYGEFKASFTVFLEEIDKYLTGIFHGDYEL